MSTALPQPPDPESHAQAQPAKLLQVLFGILVMPIRAEYRKFYRADWRRLRLALLEAAGNLRQRCGRPHRLLNVAHLSHDPADRRRVAVLCPSCHARHDTKQRIAATRRTRAQRRGQLWLSLDLELAAVPARLLPPRLRQLELF